jgi:hypothetical protein
LSPWTQRTVAITGALQLIALAAFVYAGQRADAAMDKSGIGDAVAFQRWNSIGNAAAAAYLAVQLHA